MKDPEAALRKLRELRDELEGFERLHVAYALKSGSSFGAIAKAMSISRQAAHRRYRHLAPTAIQRLPLSSHGRRALHLAREAAAALGARRVGSEHLLLGVLQSGGGASRALEASGVTADAAWRCLADNGSEDGKSTGRWVVGRAVLAEAAEIAQARSAKYVDADHVALAALDASDGGALRAITALGVTPAGVRERLGC